MFGYIVLLSSIKLRKKGVPLFTRNIYGPPFTNRKGSLSERGNSL